MKKILKSQSDSVLFAVVAILILFGLIMLTSASGPVGYERFGDTFYFVKHQILFGFIPGLALCLIAYRVNYRFFKTRAFLFLVASIVLLILVFVPGLGSGFGTSKSWIQIGNLFSIQPAEFVKLTFLFYLAAWLEGRGENRVSDWREGFLPFLTALGIIAFLMILQPDIGTMTIIAMMSLVVFFVAGGSLMHLSALLAAGAVLFALLIKISPYRAARFTTFLHPELDPQGIGYHINQALLAIGSGGIFGLGFGHSRQKFQYLPEVFGDSIFAIIGEELGLIFAVAVIALFIVFFLRGLKIAEAAPDKFGKYLVVGVVSWITIQAFVNIGSMVGIMPMTGVPLPFISYGGSALVTSMVGVAIVLNVSRHSRANQT